ncbi:hypothetical protein SUGI_0663640 [Cryptomeria japonica]|uniref:G-type lectin S-receptor-like serine/threonine-protein kinase At2g19130 n=1 Tax=Cryptomeria japonica TaxID=3369 RepID=UPI002414BEE8|nr:G-type lectin S-receptor-like serine/threonine-protein kinase At2g19130 [Cryptomeria japonica]GLJ32956.1 hypothetical protein SUGI_0663640 [Cryptomeria japonica]
MGEIRENLCLRLFFVFAVFIQLKSYGAAVEGGDTLSLDTSLTENQTIISKNGTFELGFFNPNGTSNWYVGIWYANITQKTVVWVANRESPARKRSGVLKLSKEGDLGLFDATGASLWLVNVTKKASQAVILDSGNFVMLSDDYKTEIVWQSFDYPVDTLFPGMRIGGQQKLACWKSSLDPAPGLFSFHVDPSGAKQFVLTWNNSVQYWTSGTWDGHVFSQIPEMTNKALYNISVEDTNTGLYITYTWMILKHELSRFVLVKSGVIQQYSLLDDSRWNLFWFQPRDQCAVYGQCGAYGSCKPNNIEFCSCVEGFTPLNNYTWASQEWWFSGCVRQSPLNCYAKNGSTDGFVEPSVTLPDVDSASSYPATSKKDCQKACLLNCSCTAFSFNPPSGPCQIWSVDLLNMHKSESKNSSNVFIRVDASALSKTDRSSSSKRITSSIVLGIVGAATVTLSIFSILMWRWHRQRHWLRSMERCADSSDPFLRMFSYMELKIATRNFRYKLGSGGFGTVFKGYLIDDTLVAVKRLEGSRQDEKQFRAEISSLGNIQHANLVRLRGFCVQGLRRLLIYDYLPNGSLNSLLFTNNIKRKQKVLDWTTRFQIALGTARGLLYLHEECRNCIIHCDVKPENILLDNNFSPKLGDFGLAKLVGRDFSRVLTTTRGTRGYLAPEWISGLPIPPKVDVYSFGMTLLEIISGRRTLDLTVQDSNQYYFPGWVATQIYNGNMINIVEEGIAEERDLEEVRRASIVGLLCIEKDEEVRPSMRQVVLMLEGKMQPQIPQIQSSALMDKKADVSDTDSSSSER